MRYRIAGTPSTFLAIDDLLIEDSDGRSYLATFSSRQLTRLDPDEATLVSGLYQPSADINWRSEGELFHLLDPQAQQETVVA
jgi:hypothetical protein